MIARAVRQDARPAGFDLADRVGRAAELERAGALEVLALDEDAFVELLVQSARGHDGRAVRDATDALGRVCDIAERELVGQGEVGFGVLDHARGYAQEKSCRPTLGVGSRRK